MRRCASCLSPITSKKIKCESCRYDNSKIKVAKSVIPPGKILDGRYYLGNVLGQGGFGITYKGFDQDLNRLVAIKEYYPKHNVERAGKGLEVTPNNEGEFRTGLKYFTDEARALARFQGHQNIVSVLSYFKTNGTAYMVMEYIEGRTVREILKGGATFPAEDAISTILLILDGLRACHETNLIHRDLTPDNIYITKTGLVKILDFGSARETKEGEENEFTQILKQSYAPVEQYQKGAQGPWTDIYSVGATFYRLLTGKPPAQNSVERLLSDELKKPSELGKGIQVSSQVEEVLMKALAVRPEDRYQHVDSFKADLLNASQETHKPQVSTQQVKKKPPAKTKTKEKQAPKVEEKTSGQSNYGLFIGLAAALAIVVGYVVLTPASSVEISEYNPREKEERKDPEMPPPDDSIIPDPPKVERAPKPQNPISSGYALVVKTFPTYAKIRILGTPETYEEGMRLSEGEYTAEAWADGYRLKREAFSLTKNKTITLTLNQLETPSVKVMNDFLDLTKAANTEKVLTFKKRHKRHIPLSAVGEVLLEKDVFLALENKAKIGDAESNFVLGVIFSEGIGKRKDIVIARNFLKKADLQDYLPATAWLAKSYSCAFTTEECNDNESNKLFAETSRKVAISNYLKAELMLKKKNKSEARNLLKKASDAGVNAAHYLWAEIENESGNKRESERLWKKAADLGNTDSMMRLASLYANDTSTVSERWLNKAYKAGHQEAGVFLALKAVEDNPSTFFKLANETASKGVEKGSFLKGWAYYQGISVRKDWSLAKENFSNCPQEPNCKVMHSILVLSGSRKSSLTSLESALLKLDNDANSRKDLIPQVKAEMYYQLGKIYTIPSFKPNPQKASNYFIKASNLNQHEALSYLCNMYQFGNGVVKSKSKAYEQCEKAYSLGSKDPTTLIFLGQFFEKGGLNKKSPDLKKALKFYGEACSLMDGLGCCHEARLYSLDSKNRSLQQVSSVNAKTFNFDHCDY